MKKVIITLSILCGFSFTVFSMKNFIFADTSTTVYTQNSTITQDEAHNLLVQFNNTVNYIYQGNADDFDALKSKNLTGYVFLPDVPTDIGYFVDDKTSEIYFFHPSGYIEQAYKK
jgi:hypothetical protein